MPRPNEKSSVAARLRIAAFGLRSLPPDQGSAGSETFGSELYTRLAARGHQVTVYCRRYHSGGSPLPTSYKGLDLIHLRTTKRSGFDSLLHSFLCTVHIIVNNTGNVVHIHNGGNSIWGLPLRLFGKRVCVSQDGLDWKRGKWKWYARLFLRVSMYVTAYVPNATIFDNVFAQNIFEKKFRRKYNVIPYGADLAEPRTLSALRKFGLKRSNYFLFVGRFIPDKGIHYLIEAFESVATRKQLVIVGGSPNPGSDYERSIRATKDPRIRFLGFVYGDDVLQLMKGSYCYVQPSDVEGMSPVILTAMGAGVPLICSDIPENVYIAGRFALLFERSNVSSLRSRIEGALHHPRTLYQNAAKGRGQIRRLYSWDAVTGAYEKIFQGSESASAAG